MRRALLGAVSGLLLGLSGLSAAWAEEWSLAKAAAPLKGTEITMMVMDRPGYRALAKMLPAFEQETGIKVKTTSVPYENLHERQVLSFNGESELSVALVDVVWVGEFAENKWILPASTFTADATLTDPKLNMPGFFPLLVEAFGSWAGTVYGLPFDNYSGLMFYNKCHLSAAGFDKPPATWEELLRVYAPKLTDKSANRYAYVLQSMRGETQSADAFMRVLWPFGGSLLTKEFRSNLLSAQSQAGLKFRQELLAYMPPGTVSFDHMDAVNALAQGQVSMITDWSAFYPTLSDPKTSKITECLAVAPEPAGPAGRLPALGGFSLAVSSQASPEQQKAAWLFIQWATSEAVARTFVEAGGVTARKAIYEQPDIQAKFSYVKPLVESWQRGIVSYRPRFPDWPAISDVIAEWGTKMELGQVSTEQGAKEIGTRMETILQQSGYYDGAKTALQ